MEPKFTGPSFTIGIEEELMILDAETLGLTNAIDGVLEEYGDDGDVKPELMESVLEIATHPHRDTRRAGAGCASAQRARTRSRCGRTSASPPARATAT